MPMTVVDQKSGNSDGTWINQRPVYRCLELRQIRFAEGSFQLEATERFHFDELLPGWMIPNKGMTAAVLDGEELLLPLPCRKAEPEKDEDRYATDSSIGVARWVYRQNRWRIKTMSPVATDFSGYEPSMIRSSSGELLLTARKTAPKGDWDKFGIPCWASADGGESWQERFFEQQYRANSPLVLGTNAAGDPFVIANPLMGGINQRSLGYSRELLVLWPVRPDGSGLETARFLRCGQVDFGPAPTPNGWKLDHPCSAVIEDEAGRLRTLITYRVQASDENKSKDIGPTPSSGVHIEELHIT
jgi:hypothetical protein